MHIAAWTCFFLLPIVFFPRFREPNYKPSEPFIWMLITMNSYLVLFFYSNTQILIPKLLAKKKWLWYFLVIVGCLLIYTQIPKLFEDAIRAELPEKVKQRMSMRKRSVIPYPFTGSTAVFFLVFTVSTCMKVIQQWLRAEKKKQEVEHDKLVSELSFLRSQINPHFLFNTLNNIYSLAVVKSDATAGAVMQLSSIMRYVLNETKNDSVPIENEIKFIQDYIQLQKMRLTSKVDIVFNIEGAPQDKMIAPLILIPFVENAFKYGISTKEHSTISLSLTITEQVIQFMVVNPVSSTNTAIIENTGIGLKNTKRRLELLYPERHELTIEEKDKIFTVKLTLRQ